MCVLFCSSLFCISAFAYTFKYNSGRWCTFGRTARRATRPEWIYSKGVYLEPRAEGKERIFGLYKTNKQTNKQTRKFHCGSAFRFGRESADHLITPCYCAPLVRVPAEIGVLAVWRYYKPKNKNHKPKIFSVKLGWVLLKYANSAFSPGSARVIQLTVVR